jgi:beta-N-acetylhexosaminidase
MRLPHAPLRWLSIGARRRDSRCVRPDRAAIVALLACASGCSTAAPPSRSAAPPPASVTRPGPFALAPDQPLPPAHQAWIEATLASLPLRDRVAQMVMIWVLGDYTSAGDAAFAAVTRQVETLGLGGVVMSLGSPIEVAAKVNYLQARARLPLLVASDVEPGLGRLEGGVFAPSLMTAGSATVLPSNMAIGAGGSAADAEEAGRITGREARAIGIHLAFAPTADVNNNPANPVINTRSFGERPADVARLTAAFVRGVQAGGAAATLKHFPGHGDTDVDSHLGLPVIQVARSRLDSVELVPFRAGIAAGAAGVMTAHIALPRAYGDSAPATLKAEVMTGLLRDTLGFRGLTVTDALTMDGVARGYGVAESAVRAVRAGDDILLMPGDAAAAIDAVVAAIDAGTLSRAPVDAAVRRILELKVRTGAIAQPIVSLDALREVVGSPAHRLAAREIAQRGITLLRDRDGLVPMARGPRTLLVTYAPDNDVAAGLAFGATLARELGVTRSVRVTPRTGRAELDSLRADAARMDRVVVFTYTRTLEGAGRFAIAPPVAAFIEQLGSSGRPLVVVAGGNPYVLRQFPSVPAYLVTYGRGDALEEAAARALAGRAPIGGRAPVSLPGFFTAGDGLSRTAAPEDR